MGGAVEENVSGQDIVTKEHLSGHSQYGKDGRKKLMAY